MFFPDSQGCSGMTEHPFTTMDMELGDCYRIQSVFLGTSFPNPTYTYVFGFCSTAGYEKKRTEENMETRTDALIVWFSNYASQDSGFFAVASGTVLEVWGVGGEKEGKVRAPSSDLCFVKRSFTF